MLYEYVLTMEDEVELLWRRKMSTASWIFLLNRMVPVIMIMDQALTFAGASVRNSQPFVNHQTNSRFQT